jgi:hypothetical protein
VRLNVYSQELLVGGDKDLRLPPTSLVVKEADTGVKYSAVRLYLHSSGRLHQTPEDDDRSAITFWLPKSPSRREIFASQLEALAQWVRKAPPETGLD